MGRPKTRWVCTSRRVWGVALGRAMPLTHTHTPCFGSPDTQPKNDLPNPHMGGLRVVLSVSSVTPRADSAAWTCIVGDSRIRYTFPPAPSSSRRIPRTPPHPRTSRTPRKSRVCHRLVFGSPFGSPSSGHRCHHFQFFPRRPDNRRSRWNRRCNKDNVLSRRSPTRHSRGFSSMYSTIICVRGVISSEFMLLDSTHGKKT